jgi:hypothetical protein
MTRPLIPQERVEVELSNLDGVAPGIFNLIACTMFQVGMLIGGYPRGRVRVSLRKEVETETLRMQVDMTIPLEDLDV